MAPYVMLCGKWCLASCCAGNGALRHAVQEMVPYVMLCGKWRLTSWWAAEKKVVGGGGGGEQVVEGGGGGWWIQGKKRLSCIGYMVEHVFHLLLSTIPLIG